MKTTLMVAAVTAGCAMLARSGRNVAVRPVTSVQPATIDPNAAVRAARRLNRSAGVLAGSVLMDSAVEHYRGSFHNTAMITPLVASSFSLLVSAHGNVDKRPKAHGLRDLIYAGAALTGAAGTAFHVYNLSRQPGGLTWQNLFYAAPLGAPAALALSGSMGYLAERTRDTTPGRAPRILGFAAGRVVAAASSLGLLGTTGEAGLLHFRGAFQNPAMLLPVTVPPVAAGLLGHAALAPGRRPRWMTRQWLRLTALLGVAGVGFHAYGVSRAMGGWRNWQQNMVDGPPLPAPPSFTGLALAGLAALGLLEDHPDD